MRWSLAVPIVFSVSGLAAAQSPITHGPEECASWNEGNYGPDGKGYPLPIDSDAERKIIQEAPVVETHFVYTMIVPPLGHPNSTCNPKRYVMNLKDSNVKESVDYEFDWAAMEAQNGPCNHHLPYRESGGVVHIESPPRDKVEFIGHFIARNWNVQARAFKMSCQFILRRKSSVISVFLPL